MVIALIVEDSPDYCEMLRAVLLASAPFLVVKTAAGIRDALALVRSTELDLLFVDVVLADGNGLDLTRRIRALEIGATIIILTNHDLPEYRAEAIRSGADRFIPKDAFDAADIRALVDTIVAERFRELIIADDAVFREQMGVFLSRAGPPRSVVASVAGWDEGLAMAARLKPDLVVVELPLSADEDRRYRAAVRAACNGGIVTVVSVGGSQRNISSTPSHDYFVSKDAAFSPCMEAIVQTAVPVRPGNA